MTDAGAETGTGAGNAGGAWPATVVHVNEDGWVLLNRGAGHGVAPGTQLLVVGDEPRELYDTAPTAAQTSAGAEPHALLRVRRTYELLEVVYAEERCAVAIAARVPRERRPQVYRAPDGDLLVWVPLPPEYTWPRPAASDVTDVGDGTSDEQDLDENAEDVENAVDEEQQEAESLADEQEDERWEQALPLNGIHVGDLVVPALSVSAASGASPNAASADPAPAEQQDTPFDAGRDYDWLDKPSS